MQNLSPKVTLISSLTISLLSSVNHAYALEGKALLEKLISESAADRKLSWDSATEQSADSFTLKGVKFITMMDEPAIIENLVVEGLREASNGQVEFDAISASNIASVTNNGELLKIQSIQSSKLSLPALLLTWTFPEEVQNSHISFEGFSIDNVDINHPNGTAKLASLKITNANVPLKYRYFDALSGDVSDAPPPIVMGSLDLNSLSSSSNGVDWALGSITMTDAAIPTSLQVSQVDWMKMYTSMAVKNMSASFAGTNVFSLAELSAKIDKPDSEGTVKADSVMEGLIVNLKAIPDPNTQQIAAQLGYEKIEGSMTGLTSFNPTTGKIAVEDMIMKFKDMADFEVNYGISGYTEDVARVFNKAQVESAMGKSPLEAYMPHLPILSKVMLDGFKLKLTDHSLTGKLLDFQGSQMGSTGEQLAQGAPMMLGMGMAGLQMPEFTEMVTKAVGTFLQKQGSLTVESKIDEPVSIVEAFMAGQVDPKSVPKLLKLEIVGE